MSNEGSRFLVQSGIKSGKLYREIAAEPQPVARGGNSFFMQRGHYGTPILRYSHVFSCCFSSLVILIVSIPSVVLNGVLVA